MCCCLNACMLMHCLVTPPLLQQSPLALLPSRPLTPSPPHPSPNQPLSHHHQTRFLTAPMSGTTHPSRRLHHPRCPRLRNPCSTLPLSSRHTATRSRGRGHTSSWQSWAHEASPASGQGELPAAAPPLRSLRVLHPTTSQPLNPPPPPLPADLGELAALIFTPRSQLDPPVNQTKGRKPRRNPQLMRMPAAGLAPPSGQTPGTKRKHESAMDRVGGVDDAFWVGCLVWVEVRLHC